MAASALTTIPRFLLPRRGPVWQAQGAAGRVWAGGASSRTAASPASGCLQPVRHASARAGKAASSTTPPPPSHTLAQPDKFNPPSHGSRMPRKGARPSAPASQHYGGDLSAAAQAAQRQRQYPGMAPPPGTWAHWFWTSRALHLTLTMSTLAALAVYTLVANFRRTSPFVDLLPTWADAAAHPLQAARTAWEVVRLTEHHRGAEIAARRQQRVDDVAKRTLYRKAHGLDETVGFGSNGGWFSRKAPPAPVRNEPDDESATTNPASSPEPAPAPASAPAADDEAAGKRKKFLGVF